MHPSTSQPRPSWHGLSARGLVTVRLLILLSLFPLPGCYVAPPATPQPRQSSASMPLSGPERLHRLLAPAILSNERFDDYSYQLTQRLLAAARGIARDPNGPLAAIPAAEEHLSPDAFRLHLTTAVVPNIYSAGGRRIYLTRALLERTGNEDELAAAIAHALAHLLLDHTEDRARLAAQGGPPAAIALRLADAHYAPAQEQRAHELAFALHLRAGWDPGRYLSLWEPSDTADSSLSMIKSRLDRLPPIAWDYARPAIADERWFNEFKEEVSSLKPALEARFAEQILAALPSALVLGDEAQLTARQALMRQLSSRSTPPTSLSAGSR